MRGVGAAELAGTVVPAMGTAAGIVFESAESRSLIGSRLDGARPDALAITDGEAVGPALFVALHGASSVWAVLAVMRRPGSRHFTVAEVGIADDLAGRVSLAIELARAREGRQRALLVEDRSRIARDLHDLVIQQLFGTGLELQSLAATSSDPDAPARLEAAVVTLDEAISQIRTIIFAITPREGTATTLRHRILDVAAECSKGLPRPVSVSFGGPVDLVVTAPLADDVVAVARELLTNSVRHASAAQVRLGVAVDDEIVRVEVDDDGRGIPEDGRRSGLANLAERAALRGGELSVTSSPGATAVRWSVPVEPDGGAAT